MTPADRRAARPGGKPRNTRAGARDRSGAPATARPAPPAPKRQDPPRDVHVPDGIRLQKVMAEAGVGSRRACEALITAGRVEVDGQLVTELGVRVDPKKQVVIVDGVRLQTDTEKVYLALNKPPGVVSTMSDPEDRPTLADFLTNRPLEERLFHVGRLDVDTEGLIILTNDGDLANRLAHPSHEVAKTYLAEVAGPVGKDVGRKLRSGVELEDGFARVDSFKLVDARPGKALIEIELHEGRNHIVRRMLDSVGYPVLQLVRTQVGPIRLGDLRSGRTRSLHGVELTKLFEAAGL
jgi:23S rRNA pseudouridine2605 synthase